MKKSGFIVVELVLILACLFSCVPGKSEAVVIGSSGSLSAGKSSGLIKVKQTVFAIREGSSDAAALYYAKMAIPMAISPYVSPLVFVRDPSGLHLSRKNEYRYSLDETATLLSGDGFSVERISITIDVESMPDFTERVTVSFAIDELQASGESYKADPAGYALSKALKLASAQRGTAWIAQAKFNPETREFSFEVGIGR